MTAYADPNAVAQAAQRWSDEWLTCRTYGHTWRPQRAIHNERLHYWQATRVCIRCDTVKYEEINERGMVLASGYSYPFGYLSKGLGYIAGEARGVLRLEALRRTFENVRLTPQEARTNVPRYGKTRREVGME